MKREYLKYSFICLLIIGAFTLLASCGSGGGGEEAGTGEAAQEQPAASTVSNIVLKATPGKLAANGMSTSTIQATVTDKVGAAVADGEIINFSVSSGTGTISPSSASTTGGAATVTYTASNSVGTETITANATNNISQSVNVVLGNLAGTVYNSDGTPAVGADAYVFSPVESSKTDEKGGFVFNVSQAVHTLMVSKAGSIDSYQIVDLSGGGSKNKTFLLGDSLVPAVTVLSSVGYNFTSNSINGYMATLNIPVQGSGFGVGDDTGLTSAGISLEYLDIAKPLPVPLPSSKTLAPADVKIGDKQAPSVLVAINPALLSLDTAVTLTLPNPDNIAAGTRILRFDPETHLWVDTGAVVDNSPADGTPLNITKGGLYGIFYETVQVSAIKGSATPGSLVFLGDEVFEVPTDGVIYIKDVHIPSSGGLDVMIYNPSTGTITQSSVTPVSGSVAVIKTAQTNVATVTLSAGSSALNADGKSQTTITALVLNSAGSPVPNGTKVDFSATDGTPVAASATTVNGKASFTLTSSTNAGSVAITGMAEGVSGNTTITFIGVPNVLSLSISQISVKSDNSDSTTVTATVLDSNNVPVEGVQVTFSATGGKISASTAVTDVNGEATIDFSSGTAEKKNQVVTITASVKGLAPKLIPVQVTGTTITLTTEGTGIALEIDAQNPSAAKGTLKITVQDAGLVPIYDAPVTVSVDPSSTGAVTFDSGVITYEGYTGVSGELKVEVTGTGAGNVIVNGEALGATATQTYTVSAVGEVFGITSPTEDPYSLSTSKDLTITVNAPTQTTVLFATTFGTLTGTNETGQAVKEPVSGGSASVVLNSTSAGVATIQASDYDDSSTTDSMKVAISAPSSEAFQIALQANANVLAKSTGDVKNFVTLNATVKNASDQVVGGAPVLFSIENPTGGGETISPAIAYTDDYGVASATFTSGSLSSDAAGVSIYSNVLISNPATTGSSAQIAFADADPDTITRTDGGSFITDGFSAGDQIKVTGSTDNDGLYTIETVTATILTLVSSDSLATEAAGASVNITYVIWDSMQIVIGGTAGSVMIGHATTVTSINNGTAYQLPMSVLVADTNGNAMSGTEVSLKLWPSQYATGSAFCTHTGEFPNEDTNKNLIMGPGEDLDGDGQLTPPSSAAGSVPATVTTDENGVADFNLVYLKASACWIEVEISASTLVLGTETQSKTTFWLSWMVSEAPNLPPSPYGP